MAPLPFPLILDTAQKPNGCIEVAAHADAAVNGRADVTLSRSFPAVAGDDPDNPQVTLRLFVLGELDTYIEIKARELDSLYLQLGAAIETARLAGIIPPADEDDHDVDGDGAPDDAPAAPLKLVR